MRRIIIVSIGFLLLMGCGSKHGRGGNVSGTIHYKGKPVNGAVLHFHPVSSEEKADSAGKSVEYVVPVTQEGKFESSDIPPGEYKVVVEATQIPPQAQNMPVPDDPEMKKKFQQMQGEQASTIAFPDKYKTITSTDLKCTIKLGRQQLPLELK